MEPNPEPLATYYNPARRRSFFLSRLFVMTSMLVLIIALAVNISFLSSQQRTDTRSRASSNSQNMLPSLPAGCLYQQTGNTFKVVCPTSMPSPTGTSAFPVTVELPKLPAQCNYQTTTAGSIVKCDTPQAIPTAAVSFSSSCTIDETPGNALVCIDKSNKRINVSLPLLPQGCGYKKVSSALYVSCNGTL